MKSILYVFSGEKAQGAEIVIERLMMRNAEKVSTHLFIAPGDFADSLIAADKPYQITTLNGLRRLFRSNTGGIGFYFKALKNHFKISHAVSRYVKREKIDIIHANNIVAASYLLPARMYAKFFRRKIIWLWSDHDMGYESKIDRTVSRIAAYLYDATLAVSKAVSRKYGGNKKVQVLYNGIDTGLFKPDSEIRRRFRAGLSLPADAILIGMAAKITRGKGQLGLAEAFTQIRKKIPAAYLIFAGGYAEDDADYADRVRSAIAADDRVIYAGFLRDVIPFYNACDILVSNSDHTMSESLGTSIYEAMAFEKIVVASDTGGTPEIITDDVDGLLFNAENSGELYSKLLYAAEHFSSLSTLRAAARTKVIGTFNIIKMVKQYNAILDQLAVLKA